MKDEDLLRVYDEAYRAVPADKDGGWTDEAAVKAKARRHLAGLRAVAAAAKAAAEGAPR